MKNSLLPGALLSGVFLVMAAPTRAQDSNRADLSFLANSYYTGNAVSSLVDSAAPACPGCAARMARRASGGWVCSKHPVAVEVDVQPRAVPIIPRFTFGEHLQATPIVAAGPLGTVLYGHSTLYRDSTGDPELAGLTDVWANALPAHSPYGFATPRQVPLTEDQKRRKEQAEFARRRAKKVGVQLHLSDLPTKMELMGAWNSICFEEQRRRRIRQEAEELNLNRDLGFFPTISDYDALERDVQRRREQIEFMNTPWKKPKPSLDELQNSWRYDPEFWQKVERDKARRVTDFLKERPKGPWSVEGESGKSVGLWHQGDSGWKVGGGLERNAFTGNLDYLIGGSFIIKRSKD